MYSLSSAYGVSPNMEDGISYSFTSNGLEARSTLFYHLMYPTSHYSTYIKIIEPFFLESYYGTTVNILYG